VNHNNKQKQISPLTELSSPPADRAAKGRTLMKPQTFFLSAALLATSITGNHCLSQNPTGTIASIPASSSAINSLRLLGSVAPNPSGATSAVKSFVRLPPPTTTAPQSLRPFSRLGFDWHTGLAGIGFDVATPLSRSLNVRTGSDFFHYSTAFQQQGANVAIALRMRSGHASLDWFPFHGRFRLSPQLVFANNNRIQATALIPPGSTITLNGQNYISSLTDPMHGSGTIEFRKLSPGMTLGFGNIIPRTRSHISIPIELGFYYAGQPGLKVNFSGSACDPTQPAAIGCQSVSNDPGFQHDLSAFISRNNNNLSYISFMPTFSIGFGYAF
jgi:hypothetical protein